VLLDIRMPNLDGLQAARQILASNSNRARVIMLTTFDLDEYVYDALKAGASGFLRKDAPPPGPEAGWWFDRLPASPAWPLLSTVRRSRFAAACSRTRKCLQLPGGPGRSPVSRARSSLRSHVTATCS
jgi:CheY-like chemotaxis protein